MSHTILSLEWITYAKERKRRPNREHHAKERKRRPNKEHQCGIGQVPSEGQVKSIFTTPEC